MLQSASELPKRKVTLAVVVICIVIIASVGVILYLQRKGKEPRVLSYQELCADFDVETWKFRSFGDGDVVSVKDTVLAVNCTDTLFGTYTHVTFSSMSYSESSFSVPSIPPLSIHLVGNLTEEYVANEEVEIQSHVRTYTIGKKTATILEEWHIYFLCAYYNSSIPSRPTLWAMPTRGDEWHVNIGAVPNSWLLYPQDVEWYLLDKNNTTIDYGTFLIINLTRASQGPFFGVNNKANITWSDANWDERLCGDSVTLKTLISEGVFGLKYRPTGATIAETYLYPYIEKRYVSSEWIGGKYNATLEHWQSHSYTWDWESESIVGRWYNYSKIVYTKDGEEYRGSLPYFKDALDWIKNNTDENATVLAWWEYGHGIRGYTGREVIADAPSLEIKDTVAFPEEQEYWGPNERIVDISNALTGTPEEAIQIMKKYNASYILVDPRMFPFTLYLTGIFHAPVAGASKNLSDFYEILVMGVVVDERWNTIRHSEWLTWEDFIEWRSHEKDAFPKCHVYISEQRLRYKEHFFNSTFYKAYIGYTWKDVGATYYSENIPYNPMPAWMQKNFRLVYTNQGVRILKYYEGAIVNGTLCWENGTPVENAWVTVIDDFSIPHQRVKTNETGFFSLIAPFGLKENNYNVTIIASIGELDEIAEKIMQISTEALNRTIIKITEDQADRVYDYEISLVLVGKSE